MAIRRSKPATPIAASTEGIDNSVRVFDDGGQLLTGSFLDYTVPRASHVPPIETVIVEVPAPDGPYGARGVGEAPVCGGAAAVANAIARASGARGSSETGPSNRATPTAPARTRGWSRSLRGR